MAVLSSSIITFRSDDVSTLTGNYAEYYVDLWNFTYDYKKKIKRSIFRVDQTPQTPTIRDSRPDITAWPTPPGSQAILKRDNSPLEEQSKFMTMLKVATGSSGDQIPFINS